ncbi:MAG TPA: PLP-dependent aminotransferase family protein, partial [Geminicoccaceae bacterium]|nr:PLP-dependent aminotransferase family protein [Geminicoccaceae bacterium]
MPTEPRPVPSRPDDTSAVMRFARWTGRCDSDTKDFLTLTERPDVISLAGGLPAPEIFPANAVAAAVQSVLKAHAPRALQYGPTEGIAPLRRLIAERMSAPGGRRFGPENVLITAGAQQGLDLVGKVFLERGDRLVTQRPTFLGALDAWRPREPVFEAIGWDGDGRLVLPPSMDGGARRPKFIYALPNFRNPTGETLTRRQRTELLAAAAAHRIPIVEDDPYGYLRYDGTAERSLIAMAEDASGSDVYGGDVLYHGSFSKTLMPGLRVGWVAAAPAVIERLALAKQGADLGTSPLSQYVICELLTAGIEEAHLRVIRAHYRARRDAMLAALERHLPGYFTWTRPEGGLFVWVT